jgi:hypothetical protein
MANITQQEKIGLTIGSLLAAGAHAAMGNSPREAIIGAALGGTQAYGKGIQALYDQKAQELQMERSKDLLETSQINKMILSQEMQEKEQKKEFYLKSIEESDKPTYLKNYMRSVSPPTAVNIMTPREKPLGTPEQAARREYKYGTPEYWKAEEKRATLGKTEKPSRTNFLLADTMIPNAYPNGDPIDPFDRKRFVLDLGVELNKNPGLTKDKTKLKQKVKEIVQPSEMPKLKPSVPSPDVQQKWNPFDWGGRFDVTQEEKSFIDKFNSLTPEQQAKIAGMPKYQALITKLQKYLQQ